VVLDRSIERVMPNAAAIALVPYPHMAARPPREHLFRMWPAASGVCPGEA